MKIRNEYVREYAKDLDFLLALTETNRKHHRNSIEGLDETDLSVYLGQQIKAHVKRDQYSAGPEEHKTHLKELAEDRKNRVEKVLSILYDLSLKTEDPIPNVGIHRSYIGAVEREIEISQVTLDQYREIIASSKDSEPKTTDIMNLYLDELGFDIVTGDTPQEKLLSVFSTEEHYHGLLCEFKAELVDQKDRGEYAFELGTLTRGI